jgi:osmotically inducible protein OsmC
VLPVGLARRGARTKLDASDSRIVANVGIGPTGEGGFGLQVSLDLHAPHVSHEEAVELMRKAHERCPCSNATRGNIDVSLAVDNQPLDVAATADH